SIGVTAINSNGIVAITGADNRYTLSLGVTVNRGNASYSIGVIDPFNVASATLVAASGQGWSAGPTTGSGTITITSLTSTSVSGTFSIVTTPLSGGAVGNKSLTTGSFNIPLTGPPQGTPGAGGVHGSMQATIDGAAWQGA